MPKKSKKGNSKTPLGKIIAYLLTAALALVLFFAIPYAAGSGIISKSSIVFYASAAFSLLLSAFSVSYLYHKGVKPAGIVRELGISRSSFSVRNVMYGIVIFLIILGLEVAVSLASSVLNMPINTNVGMLLSGAPFWFLAFVSIIAPINEEIFFRGLLVKRIGILLSALLFALMHASYNSTFGIEVIAAFIFGSIAGYVFKKTGSLYPTITAHILVNLLAVLVT
jgi:membrane protease YdiL (CAAX protease family)